MVQGIPTHRKISAADSNYSADFLTAQAHHLIDFSKGSHSPLGGFGYLDSIGGIDTSKPRELYIQCRMVQVFGLGTLLGLSDNRVEIDYGIDAILDLFHDKTAGGFFNAISEDNKPVTAQKLAYDHMFVLLAACTAKVAGNSRADELFSIIDAAIDKYFWNEKSSMMNNSWNNDFSVLDSYRGINANMHAVEALCAAYDVTKNRKYLDRAYTICERAINQFARSNGWMLPEHFNQDWVVDKEFNVDNPADAFCPYGVTIGHLFEWSRLLMHLKLQISETELDASWITESALALYEIAKSRGWHADGSDGFVYTIDWEGKPVVRSRMFWVAAEATMTAYVLWCFENDAKFINDYTHWWKYIDAHVLDKKNGSWIHELDADQNPVAITWPGKPDTYHAFNACVLPIFNLGTSFIGTVLDLKA